MKWKWPWSKEVEERSSEPVEEQVPNSGSDSCSFEQLINNPDISRSKAKEIPAVSAAIGKLAATVAKLPLRLYTTESGKPQEVKDDKRPFLLSVDSGDTLDIASFWRAIINDYYLGTGGYIYIDKYRGKYRSLRYVDCNEVFVAVNNNPIFKDYNIYVRGKRYFPFDFIKILRYTKNGADSKSIVDENGKVLSVAYETLRFERKQVSKGGNKRGYFQSERKLGEDALRSLKTDVKKMNLSHDDSEHTVVLNDGIKFQETSSTAAELQLNENKKTNNDEIFSIFGFPSTVIKGGATEKDMELFTDCVVELLTVIESALDKDLLLECEKGTKYFAFDTRELTRGKIKERYEGYKIALEKGIMLRDEIREIEDLPPLGFNFIELNLADALYNPHSKEVYVLNTGAKQKLDDGCQTIVKGGE